MTFTLPTELTDQIAETAAALGASLDQTVAVLLRYGLAVQMERDREIAKLAEQIASSTDEDEINSANNQLGEMIFGR